MREIIPGDERVLEQSEVERNVVDREFNDLEELPLSEQRLFLPDAMARVLHSSELQTEAFRSGALHKHGPNMRVTNFALPSALFGGSKEEQERYLVEHGALPQTKGIKPNYVGKPATYYESTKRSFFEINQCCMWEIQAGDHEQLRRPYLCAFMSECALLVGRSEERLIAAHTSYGEARDVEAAFNYMRERGVPQEHIYAIPSFTKTRLYKDNPLYLTAQQYEDLGILPEHILSFEPSFLIEETKNTGEEGGKGKLLKKVWKNMGEAIITPLEIVVYQFDLTTEFHDNYFYDPRTISSEPQFLKSVLW